MTQPNSLSIALSTAAITQASLTKTLAAGGTPTTAQLNAIEANLGEIVTSLAALSALVNGAA